MLILLLGCTLLASPAQIAAQESHTTPLRPLLLLTVFDPWNMVVGSDSPQFAVYENGLIIYQREHQDGERDYAAVTLSQEAFDTFLRRLNIGETFYQLDGYYDTVLITDQPTTMIYVYDPETEAEHTVYVYGNPDSAEVRAAAPREFFRIYDKLTSYHSPDAARWLPTHFEVVLWPYDSSDAAAWPQGWPSLDDPLTVERGSVTSLYLPIAQYERFLALAEDASALAIDGQTWAFSVRFPFPHEFWLAEDAGS